MLGSSASKWEGGAVEWSSFPPCWNKDELSVPAQAWRLLRLTAQQDVILCQYLFRQWDMPLEKLVAGPQNPNGVRTHGSHSPQGNSPPNKNSKLAGRGAFPRKGVSVGKWGALQGKEAVPTPHRKAELSKVNIL